MVAFRLDDKQLHLTMLIDSNYIQIHDHQLAYGTGDYVGELYRMNLSCSGGGLPESGCLFKVAGNTSTVEGIRSHVRTCSINYAGSLR